MMQFPSFVRAEIENWIAWCWAGESPEPREPSRCYSAERSYRVSNTNSEEKDQDVPPKRIIHAENAQRVQLIFDGLPQLTRRVLQYEYTQRGRYDQWERGEEVKDGQLVRTWIRVGNSRRMRARIDLNITSEQYAACLDEFKVEVFKEFECEVCA